MVAVAPERNQEIRAEDRADVPAIVVFPDAPPASAGFNEIMAYQELRDSNTIEAVNPLNLFPLIKTGVAKMIAHLREKRVPPELSREYLESELHDRYVSMRDALRELDRNISTDKTIERQAELAARRQLRSLARDEVIQTLELRAE